MVQKILKIIFLLFIFFSHSGNLTAQNSDGYLIKTPQANCQHGLHQQPFNGPFSVFLFCDDAGSANIGVILTERGAGPGKLKFTGNKSWNEWKLNDRFWQKPVWATDVTSFVWSSNYRFLFVATSSIYGSGGLYKLDLQNRKFSLIEVSKLSRHEDLIEQKGIYKIFISKLNKKKNTITVEVFLRSFNGKSIKIKNLKIG